MAYEDEPEKCLRLLRARRAEAVEQLAGGTVSADNVQGGYRQVTGRIEGIDSAIEVIRDVFRGWLPETESPALSPTRRINDY